MVKPEDKSLSNLSRLHDLIGQYERVSAYRSDAGFSVSTAPSSEWPNLAYAFDEDRIDGPMMKDLERFQSGSQKKLLLILSDNAAISKTMKEYGFRPVAQWVGMYLSIIPAHNARPGDNKFVVSRVKNQDELKSWTNIASEALFNGKELDASIFNFLRDNGNELVVARSAGEVMGTAMVFYDACGLAGIYMVSVANRFRRMGGGKAIMQYCFELISSRGIDKCVLQATKEGIALYESLGFQRTACYYLYIKFK